MRECNAPLRVTVLMAPYCSSASVATSLEVFDSANILARARQKLEQRESRPAFAVESASLDGKPVLCTGRLSLVPEKSIEQVGETDLIIVPGFMFNILQVLPLAAPLSDWLSHQAAQGAHVASICTGTFVTAQAGLLDGREATTHWYFVKEFQKRFPETILKEECTVTDDTGMICSGGVSSAIDMLLYLMRVYGSPELAADCSKKLLVDTSGRSQRPYIQHHFRRNHEDQDILKVQDWLDSHYQQDIVFEAVAQQFHFGARNFIRRFKQATGDTPIQYLQNLRIERAKFLLETTRANFDQVTLQIGYEDSNSFRRLFKTRVGVSPAEYRKKFQFSDGRQ